MAGITLCFSASRFVSILLMLRTPRAPSPESQARYSKISGFLPKLLAVLAATDTTPDSNV